MFLFGSKDLDKNENKNNSESEKEEVIQYKLEIPEHFKLPVSYLEQSNEVRDEIINDLELIDTIDDTSMEEVYATYDDEHVDNHVYHDNIDYF